MKVYIAAAYAARDVIARRIVPSFERAGHEVTSSWLKGVREIHEGTIGSAQAKPQNEVAANASNDFSDIEAADVLVLFTGSATRDLVPDLPEHWLHTGGRHTEVGYALARGKHVIVVGKAENVFQRGLCRQAEDWPGALAAISYLEELANR